MNQINKKEELYGLTIFRFVAAFYVFIFHCDIRYPLSAPSWIVNVVKNGAIGMTFFFVLSGFVLAWASRDGIRERYFSLRIARIYPAYLMMGIVSLPFLFEYDHKKIISYLFLYLTSTQSWFPTTFNAWHFGGSWSVSTEMFFYLSFPFLFPLIKRNPYATLIISYVTTSLIIPLSLSISSTTNFPQYYISPIHRLPEFTIGVALGCLYASGLKIQRYKLFLLVISILALLFISPKHNEGWMRNNYITVLSTGCIIYCLSCMKLNLNKLTKPFVYLGKISYSFYLMQLPIMLYITAHHDVLSAFPHWQIWLALGILNIAMAATCYHLIENNKKIRKMIVRVA
ncbi:acyltransferase family protein [Cedecea sp. MMO-103]|uniref:acyltransferase family protein n=1 Tax=Cedecea sp. MMO-103 TaxID=3081238 RepID=UPI003016D804